MQDADPDVEYVPATHWNHEVCPVLGWNSPPEQFIQREDDPYFPIKVIK